MKIVVFVCPPLLSFQGVRIAGVLTACPQDEVEVEPEKPAEPASQEEVDALEHELQFVYPNSFVFLVEKFFGL